MVVTISATNPIPGDPYMINAGASYGPINASPTKDFFVSMLTRDISLDDAILDLLDNCVDGILRNSLAGKGDTPYKGYSAQIQISSTHFSISDNCGGIPWKLKDYAFRMGRPVDTPHTDKPTVGIYGIGMKRAIFKIGRECIIQTWNGSDAYEVEFDEAWLRNETTWALDAKSSKTRPKEEGTTIVVGKLNESVQKEFSEQLDEFVRKLVKSIRSHYSAIIEKGFKIRVNKTDVEPLPINLAFADSGKKTAIRPYTFETDYDGVKVFVAVGFTRPLADKNEQEEEIENPKYDSDRTGWTIICNDRVIVYCDKTEKTGWGIGRTPKYHPQFNAISGVVIFESNDANKLPTITTKRGLDMGSVLYLHVRERMIEGLRIFTEFTNKWKDDLESAKKQIKEVKLMSISAIRTASTKLRHSASKQTIGGRYSKPDLPLPARTTAAIKRIAFTRATSEITIVADHLFGHTSVDPSAVGEKCFDNILKEAKRK
jgi:hypothetical protein